METLVVVDHRNEYPSRSRGSGKGFRGINCRTFHSGSRFLTPPLTKQPESRFFSPPLTKQPESRFFSPPLTKQSYMASPRTPSPPIKSQPVETKQFRRIVKSKTISLPIKITADLHKDGFFDEGFSYSELWAGPAYSNSPEPSALPIPKFCNKRGVAKSAPSSPTRDYKGGFNWNGICGADSATKNLRRILNLDVTDV